MSINKVGAFTQNESSINVKDAIGISTTCIVFDMESIQSLSEYTK